MILNRFVFNFFILSKHFDVNNDSENFSSGFHPVETSEIHLALLYLRLHVDRSISIELLIVTSFKLECLCSLI